MPFRINRAVAAVRAAPIAEAQAWIPTGSSQRRFINLCQAVPSYPPADSMMEAIAAAARVNSLLAIMPAYSFSQGRWHAIFGLNFG